MKKIIISLAIGGLIGWGLAYKFMPLRDAVKSIPCISADVSMNGILVHPPGFGDGKWIFCENEFFEYRIPSGKGETI